MFLALVAAGRSGDRQGGFGMVRTGAATVVAAVVGFGGGAAHRGGHDGPARKVVAATDIAETVAGKGAGWAAGRMP